MTPRLSLLLRRGNRGKRDLKSSVKMTEFPQN